MVLYLFIIMIIIKGQSEPLAFKFEKTLEEYIGISFKKRMKDNEWIYNEKPFQLLMSKSDYNVNNIKIAKFKSIDNDFVNRIKINIESSRNRINNNELINELYNLVAKLQNNQIYYFDWDIDLYKNRNQNTYNIENNLNNSIITINNNSNNDLNISLNDIDFGLTNK